MFRFQVCDDQWHHYAVNVRFPDVELYIDGQLFRGEKKNPEVIDDWPLHPTKGINTTLTVGACWQVWFFIFIQTQIYIIHNACYTLQNRVPTIK